MADQPVQFVSSGNQGNHPTQVTVTDIDMPFVSMMSFMVKWTLAAIPAFFVLAVVGAVGWGIIGAIFN